MADAYVFDLDGTLVDTGQHTINSFAFALGPFGVTVDEALIEKIRGRNTATLFSDLVSSDKIPIVRQQVRLYWKKHAKNVKVFPGVPEFLREISLRGYKLNIWTGRDRHSAFAILKAKGLDHIFDQVVTCDDVPVNKPSPDGLVKIAKSLNVDVKALIHVGDHDHDIEGAHAVGACAVGVRWKNSANGNSWGCKPDFYFQKTGDFLAWVRARSSQASEEKLTVKIG